MEIEALSNDYQNKFLLFGRLEQEALFILNPAIEKKKIKLHQSVLSRIKGCESFLDKVQRKEKEEREKGRAWDSTKAFEDIHDIVGLRVVCLFLSDIAKISEVIRESFSVLEEDNKVEGVDASSFGYMSVHFLATLNEDCSGPRYDSILGLKFEIQVRTIAMDAWANVSHHLSYKSDRDVPTDLKRDFYALSGLFYVADKHFELFYEASKKSQKEMTEFFEHAPPEARLQQELNLDSLHAYLVVKFPEREHIDFKGLSVLINELLRIGYKSIGDIDSMIDNALNAFLSWEKDNPPMMDEKRKFSDVGVVRICAQLLDERYHRMGYFHDHDYREPTKEELDDVVYAAAKERYEKYRPLLTVNPLGTGQR